METRSNCDRNIIYRKDVQSKRVLISECAPTVPKKLGGGGGGVGLTKFRRRGVVQGGTRIGRRRRPTYSPSHLPKSESVSPSMYVLIAGPPAARSSRLSVGGRGGQWPGAPRVHHHLLHLLLHPALLHERHQCTQVQPGCCCCERTCCGRQEETQLILSYSVFVYLSL